MRPVHAAAADMSADAAADDHRSRKSTSAHRPPPTARKLVTLEIDGVAVTVPARHVDHARGAARSASRFRSSAPPTPSSLRLVPPLPGRDRRPQGYSGLVHDAGRRGMKVTTAEPEAGGAAPRRDGALHLRPSARLPDLPGQRPLRAAGHGRRGRPARGRATATRATNHLDARRRTESTRTSPSIRRKCIVCSRCVRACEEVQGTFALTIQGRGFDSKVSASQNEPFLDSECVSCGACVEACPTATLTEKSVIDARPARARASSRPAPTAASAARSRPR